MIWTKVDHQSWGWIIASYCSTHYNACNYLYSIFDLSGTTFTCAFLFLGVEWGGRGGGVNRSLNACQRALMLCLPYLKVNLSVSNSSPPVVCCVWVNCHYEALSLFQDRRSTIVHYYHCITLVSEEVWIVVLATFFVSCPAVQANIFLLRSSQFDSFWGFHIPQLLFSGHTSEHACCRWMTSIYIQELS